MVKKLYKLLFWSGYSAVLITSVLKINMSLDKVHVNLLAFELRLDHLLHLSAYFLICMYILAGEIKDLKLFETHGPRKFIVATLLLATFTEFIQLWIPTRAFNLFDWLANLAGIGLGVIIIQTKDSRSKKKDGRRHK